MHSGMFVFADFIIELSLKVSESCFGIPEVEFRRLHVISESIREITSWEQRKLRDISSLITKGTTPLDKSGAGDVNFIKVENLDSNSGEVISGSKISMDEHEGYLKRSQLKAGDILLSIAGTLGRVGIIKSSVLPANTNQALAIIRTKEGNINYISTVLRGRAVTDFIHRNPTVGAQPNLSLEQVRDLEIPYPSLDEQKKIGDYFKRLDHLITLHQRWWKFPQQMRL